MKNRISEEQLKKLVEEKLGKKIEFFIPIAKLKRHKYKFLDIVKKSDFDNTPLEEKKIIYKTAIDILIEQGY